MKNENHHIKYPSARLTGVGKFMEFLRKPGWKPDTVDVSVLQRLGIAPSKENETVHALKFLGIIANDGSPTEGFDNLQSDYNGTMKRLVLEAYKEVFKLLPADMITRDSLVLFFGMATDTSEYQAKLFQWFCEQAGIELPNLEKRFHRKHNDKKKENQVI
jgi:hypothetical protein